MFGSKTPIGVDIGSHSVKVCQVRRTGEIFELEKFGCAPINPDGDQPSDPQQQHARRVAALKRALSEAGIKAKHSVSAISGESIIVRYLQLPEMPENELKKALQWEAEEYIPFRLSEVNIDSQILGRVLEGDHPKMDVLLVSAKKDMVEQHVAVLREAGLEPAIVDVDSFAFLNCFETNHKPSAEDSLALINIGNQITNINIYTGGVSRFSRDISIGGETITTAIRSRLGCSAVEAERLKISEGAVSVDLDMATMQGGSDLSLLASIRGSVEEELKGSTHDSPEAVAQAAIMTSLSNLFTEVRRSIEFFENQYRGSNINRVVLGGGTAMLLNLAPNLEKDLGVPVELIDPLRRFSISSRGADASRIQAIRHQLGVGIGLSLRGLAA